MNNDLGLEQLVDKLLSENKIDEAVSTLYDLIVNHAKAKNFVKAESLRQKLMDIDQFALNEIITSADIIEEEKRKNLSDGHLDIWGELYQMLNEEEGNALYCSLKEASYSNDQPLFTQGDRNFNLYFINKGQLKMLCNHGGKEFLVKKLNPGDILGIDTFFSDSICTTSVSAFSVTTLNYLEKKVLREWKEKFPSLEKKLYNYCLKFEKIHELIKKKGLDRRAQRRFLINGKASIQILGANGARIGNSFRGIVADISASGMTCTINMPQKDIGQLLIGRSMELKLSLNIKRAGLYIDRVGIVVAVSSPPFENYCLHIKFRQNLESALIREIASNQSDQSV
jgi:CRP-like cAMP-binding protein